MIVELLDYRPLRVKDPVLETPERTRVVLTPNAETLWSEICLMNQKNGFHWTDQDALEVESKILVSDFGPCFSQFHSYVVLAGDCATVMFGP